MIEHLRRSTRDEIRPNKESVGGSGVGNYRFDGWTTEELAALRLCLSKSSAPRVAAIGIERVEAVMASLDSQMTRRGCPTRGLDPAWDGSVKNILGGLDR